MKKLKFLVISDSLVTKHMFEKALEVFRREGHEISIVELDEGARWNAEKEGEPIYEYEGSPYQYIDLVEDADILLVHLAPVTRKVIEKGVNLKLIGCCRGGPVNVNIKAASERKIPVIHTPERAVQGVVELTIGFMIGIARKIPDIDRRIKEGRVINDPKYYYGYELKGKTLGLVGLGRIGRKVAEIAKTIGMNVVAYDPYVSKGDAEKIGVQLVDLEYLLKNSDFISIHARLTDETRSLLGRREIELIKYGAYLINTARGEIISEDGYEALLEALKSGKIRGAALDVYEMHGKYPVHPEDFLRYYDPKNIPELFKLDNVIITPHMGGSTQEMFERSAIMLAEEVGKFLRGDINIAVVNREALKT